MTSSWPAGVTQARVLIAPAGPSAGVGGETSSGQILSLKHPKSGSTTGYVFRNGSLHELQWFKQSYGSWFLGDYVCEDGSLYIETPVDLVFILLPLFEAARMKKRSNHGMFRELSEILYVDGYPGYQQLLPFAETSMHLLCELKEAGSSKIFRLDDSKVLAWMCHKASRLRETFSTLDKNYASRGERDSLIDVISILGEYLEDDPWLKLLCEHFQLDLNDLTRKISNDESVVSVDSQSQFVPQQTKRMNGKTTSSASKQPKKPKTEVESQNIKDMFRRVTRKRGT